MCGVTLLMGINQSGRIHINGGVGETSKFPTVKGCTHRAIILFDGAVDRHQN